VKLGLVGLALAAVAFTWVFRSRQGTFWTRMPVAAGALGLYALVARPDLRRTTPSLVDVLTAIASAAGLYAIFQLGDRLARRIMPRGTEEIDRIYQLRGEGSGWLIAMLLAGVIAPCEELFWRGLLQNELAGRFGRFRGAALAALAYGAVHLGSGNLTLTGAAATAGAFWGLQYAVQRRLPAVIVSHVIWDIWIFLIAPTQRPKTD
jgi:membrane protease YdiL (CAAX protease family)